MPKKRLILELSEKERIKIKKIWKTSNVRKEREKAGVIYFRDKGNTLDEIILSVGVSRPTIVKHIKQYIEKGMDYLIENNYEGQKSKLIDYKEEILNDFNKEAPRTLGEATIRIEKLTGIKRGKTQVRNFLKKTDFRTKNQKVYQQKQTKKNKLNV